MHRTILSNRHQSARALEQIRDSDLLVPNKTYRNGAGGFRIVQLTKHQQIPVAESGWYHWNPDQDALSGSSPMGNTNDWNIA